MLGLATFLFVALVAVVFAGALLARGGPSASEGQTSHASEITSDEAVSTVKEWMAGGTQAGVVEELIGDLICSGYYEANGTWDVRCRLPWIPVEGYLFSVAEDSGQVSAETEATMEFVRLLRQWGHVPEP